MDKLQQKLFHFEAQPPATAWADIEAALNTDEGSENSLSGKLLAYEAIPPADTWNKIERSLSQEQTPVIPLKHRFSRNFKYAGAAAVFIVAALLFISKKPSADQLTNTANGQVNPAINEAGISAPVHDPMTTDGQLSENDQASGINSESKKSAYSKYRVSLPRQSAIASVRHNDKLVIPNNLPVVKSDMPERYIVFSTSSGEAFRLSKKLFDLFACADRTENCRENIELAQQQLASPQKMASADFVSVLELLQNMNPQ